MKLSKIISRVFSVFESKMNIHYRKLFIFIGVCWGSLFFFIQDIPSQIIQYSILLPKNSNYTLASTGTISQSLIFGLGLFVFYTAVGATLFIVVGEIFIRFCEYFHINSKLYHHMVKIKDTTTMGSLEYYDKYDKYDCDKN